MDVPFCDFWCVIFCPARRSLPYNEGAPNRGYLNIHTNPLKSRLLARELTVGVYAFAPILGRLLSLALSSLSLLLLLLLLTIVVVIIIIIIVSITINLAIMPIIIISTITIIIIIIVIMTMDIMTIFCPEP